MAKKTIQQAREELRVAFGFTLFIGIVCLFALQFYFNYSENNFNSEPIWAIAFVPLFPMLAYIVFGYQLEKDHQDPRGFADSAYYFGFILTLSSLVLATFYDRFNNPDITLAYFGAALTTTLFGISFRTYHTQFLFEKEDDFLPTGERERIVRNIDEFVVGVSNLNEQLDVMKESIKYKLSSNIDDLSETISNTNAPFNSLKEGLSSHIDGITQPFKDAIGNVEEELKDAHEPIKEGLRSLGEDISDSSQPIGSAMYDIASELNGVSQPIINSINSINEKLNSEEIFIDLTELNRLSRTLNTLNNKFPDMITKLEDTSDNMINLSEEATKEYLKLLRKLNKNNIKAVEKLKEFEATIKEKENQSRAGGFGGGGFFGFGRRDNNED
tara:strand:+ start:1918 stop:3072 length:1155 start_codon:yes stop_codon:yes gene_type:complete